jgi:hypothetical protein
MPPNKSHSLLGRYAIYFRSLSDTIKDRRHNFFGQVQPPQAELEQPAAEPPLYAGPPEEKDKAPQPPVTKASETAKLHEAVKKSQRHLIKATAVFPFDLFPDTITIDRQKLTIVHRTFFFIQQTISVQLADVKNVEANLGPFFGSLTITSQHFKNNVQHINFLPRRDVVQVQHILQGIIVANNRKIDISKVDHDKLQVMLKELGEGEVKEHPEAVGDL